MKILVTGAAGFIGYNLSKRLAERGDEIVGCDNINDYYDVNLKYGRLEQMGIDTKAVKSGIFPDSKCKNYNSNLFTNYRFTRLDIADKNSLNELFCNEHFDKVCNLAAQAGVRYSLINPYAYINSNIVGFANILELSRQFNIKHLVYASSSSVYGLNETMPFSVQDNVDHPISLYAASKKSNELMAHSYSYLYNLPTTGLRFFTVYGPWGRPDMALFIFVKNILNNKPIDIYNNGNMKRDFTYIDDIVEGIVKVVDHPPKPKKNWNGHTPDPSSSVAPYKIYNIGNSKPVELMDFVEAIEKTLGKKAKKRFMPMQAGDVPNTWADVSNLSKDFNYIPNTSVNTGVKKFVEWYMNFFKS